MDISFGIVIGPKHDKGIVCLIIDSIIKQNWESDDRYEIFLIGENLYDYKKICPERIFIIDFDENIKSMWITRKKNLIATVANYENVCVVHDYLKFNNGWLEGVKRYSKDHEWQILLNRVCNKEGTRHADWLVSPIRMLEAINLNYPTYSQMLMQVAPHENGPQFVSGLPYDVSDLSHVQYVSGGFTFIKQHVIQDVPMNEDLGWGTGEDVEWSNRLSEFGYLFNFNIYSSVSILKTGKWHCYQMPDEFIKVLRNHYGSRPVQ